jgi:hypothetical protein
VSLDPDLIDAVRDLDEHELRRLLILAQARLGEQVLGAGPRIRMREQLVRCGKDSCTQCPHGPYWYAYWTENGRRRTRYVGKLIEDD